MSAVTVDRRRFLATCAAVGAGGLFPGTLWTLATQAAANDPTQAAAKDAAQGAATEAAPRVTKAMIADAARIAGVDIPDDVRDAMLSGLASALDDYDAIRKLNIPNSVAPAFVFEPLPARASDEPPFRLMPAAAAPSLPVTDEDLVFASVRDLSELLRARKITSRRLTELSLARLERLDPTLHCVVTLLRDRALAQADAADRELDAGRVRGPLHGVPWGAKDLLAVKGAPTTWGAAGFETQSFDEDATVVRRLDEAGAVLVAKLSLGALAMGDKWFGGLTRNPWRLEQGSSGSSAGSASAVAAGCVPFAIGSETLGSISSPATRCGVTGLRPSFGRVPRTGAMALSWTMDKLGPIARTAEDCAIVLDAIRGPDGADRGVRDAPFGFDAPRGLAGLRLGVISPDADAPADETRAFESAIDALGGLGVKRSSLRSVAIPDLPWGSMVQILLAEAAAAFDDLTRSGRDRKLTSQEPDDWPNLFRMARFVPAVEYIQASRARRLGMDAMALLFEDVDVILAPTSGIQLVATNLTGHPAIIVPAGFRAADAPPPKNEDDDGGPGTPISVTFLAGIDRESALLAAAHAFQSATRFHLARPALPA